MSAVVIRCVLAELVSVAAAVVTTILTVARPQHTLYHAATPLKQIQFMQCLLLKTGGNVFNSLFYVVISKSNYLIHMHTHTYTYTDTHTHIRLAKQHNTPQNYKVN